MPVSPEQVPKIFMGVSLALAIIAAVAAWFNIGVGDFAALIVATIGCYVVAFITNI